jgi:hypothetical protein
MKRHTLVLRVLALPAVALATTLPLGAQTSEPLDVDVALALGISQGYQQELDVPDTLGRAFAVEIAIGDEHFLVDLVPHSVRSDDFRLLEQEADGRLVEVDPGPITTLQGTLVEDEGSQVSGGLDEAGLFLRIRTSGGQEYWLQPLWRVVDNAGPHDYVIYRDEDVFENDGTCGADLLAENRAYVAGRGATTTRSSRGREVAELGCDADFQYFQKYGSTNAVSNRIQNVIGTMNLQYEGEVGITHDITTIIVRTTSNQPYTSTNPDTLLNQFRSEWLNNQTGVQRDTAHLFTGKNLDGTTIGIAWLSVICNTSFGYGLVQSDFNNNFASTDLSAHELRHSWALRTATARRRR